MNNILDHQRKPSKQGSMCSYASSTPRTSNSRASPHDGTRLFRNPWGEKIDRETKDSQASCKRRIAPIDDTHAASSTRKRMHIQAIARRSITSG
jgi:hypothetical protein